MRASLRSVKGHQVNNGSDTDDVIDSDNNIPVQSKVSITPFADDQMFQRWLVDRIFHRKEMCFERTAPLSNVVGFLTGMDDQYYSVSTSTSPVNSHILPRDTVAGIIETGVSLHELPNNVQIRIKRYTSRLRRACEETLMPVKRMPVPRSLSERIPQESV